MERDTEPKLCRLSTFYNARITAIESRRHMSIAASQLQVLQSKSLPSVVRDEILRFICKGRTRLDRSWEKRNWPAFWASAAAPFEKPFVALRRPVSST